MPGEIGGLQKLGEARDFKFLTFGLAGEEFGIVIMKVREIIGMMDIRPVPRTPSHVKGVINLRGKVIPIIDLRLKFGMPEIEYDDRTCIIVAEVPLRDGLVNMGIVVDSVSEVINFKRDEIEPPPDFGDAENYTDYIIGMAKVDSGVKILMDIDAVVAGDGVAMLAA